MFRARQNDGVGGGHAADHLEVILMAPPGLWHVSHAAGLTVRRRWSALRSLPASSGAVRTDCGRCSPHPPWTTHDGDDLQYTSSLSHRGTAPAGGRRMAAVCARRSDNGAAERRWLRPLPQFARSETLASPAATRCSLRRLPPPASQRGEAGRHPSGRPTGPPSALDANRRRRATVRLLSLCPRGSRSPSAVSAAAGRTGRPSST